MERLGNIGNFVGGLSGLTAIIVTYCIFLSQHKLDYKMGLNANYSEMLKTLKNIGDSCHVNMVKCKSEILKHFLFVNKNNSNPYAECLKAYDIYFSRHILCHPEVIHFLQYFKQTFEKIDCNQEIKDSQVKKKYISILSAQLSPEELFVIFFTYVARNKLLDGLDFHKYHFFEYLNTGNRYLDDVRNQMFPQEKFVYSYQRVKFEDIDLGDKNYDEEQIYETIDRLKNKKNEK